MRDLRRGANAPAIPDEIFDWFSANQEQFGEGKMSDGSPIPQGVRDWVAQAVNWVDLRTPMSEMADWELNVFLAAEEGSWPDAVLENWLEMSGIE